MRRFYQFLLLALFLPFFCIAQKNFKDGYVVSLKGDTIKGVIDYREWDTTPTSIHFRNQLNGADQTFTTVNINSFGINNLEYYQRAVIRVSVNSINITDAVFNKDTAKVLRTVFLKVLIKGNKVDLYAYADDIKTRYYYAEKGKTPVEFEYSLYNTDNGETHYKYQYRAQLTYLSLKYKSEDKTIAPLIERANYSENDFINIISKVNGDNKVISAKNGLSTFFVGGGLNYSKLKFLESALANPSTTDKQLPMPYINAGFIHYMNKTTRKMFFSFELGLFTNRHELHSEHKTSNGTSTISDVYADLKFSQYVAKINPHIGYNFYNAPNFKVFAMLGLSLNFAAYSKHDYTESYSINNSTYIARDYPDFAKLYIEPDARIGVTLGQKFDLFAGYFRGAIYDRADNNVKHKSVQAGVQYHFK